MSDTDAIIEVKLDEFESWLGRAVGDAYSAAIEVDTPGGNSPAWLALLGEYGIQSAPEEARMRAAQATGMLRGAPADELFELLDHIHKIADKTFSAIDLPDDNAMGRRWRRLQGLIGRLRDETLSAYRKQVMPKRSMFGAAMASSRAKQGQAAPAKRAGETFVMRCNKCGAPRLKKDDFVCEYCDTPYA